MSYRSRIIHILAGTTLALSSPALAQDLEEVILVVPNPSAILIQPVAAAMDQGFFADEGLRVRVEAVNGSGPLIQALAAGQAHIANPGAGTFLAAHQSGLEAKWIYRLNPNSSFSIVVLDSTEFHDPADLEGKIIGVGTADGAETSFARSIFDEIGLVEDEDYTFLEVGEGGQAVAAFLRGDIDAYAAATNDAAIINTRGMTLRNLTPEKFRSFFGNGLVVLDSLIAENPELVEGFGRALVRGADFVSQPENIDAVIQAVAAINPQEVEDREFAESLIGQIVIRQTPHDPSLGWGYQSLEAWEAWHQSLLASGELATPVENLEDVFTNEFVEEWNSVLSE
ncbi:ABC transporter substrate-binding protein [Pelagibacterium lacus]|uniref:ABC transporter substrate-binding protein n=1 Tax=Pelagibacterium lacus TaxID=2282655 RepID=A0A369W0R1_9HYPH|nr:ABC transporter substrate-binding protein [Pelagibacterium lacus]RDE08108.1 ABC transporter substrate-binding protein [Pelagibacterium lacus]